MSDLPTVGSVEAVERGLIDVSEAAERLKLSGEGVRRLLRRDRVKPVARRPGKGSAGLYRLEDIDAIEVSPQAPRRRTTCTWPDGCQNIARIHGLCLGHYQTARYNAEHEHLIPPESRALRCFAPECANPQYSDGLCRSHRQMVERGTPLVNEIPRIENDAAQAILTRRRLLGYTLEDVGSIMGLTRERVRQIELRLPKDIETQLFLPSTAAYLDAIGVSVEELVGDIAVTGVRTSRRKLPQARPGSLRDRVERLEAALLRSNETNGVETRR